MTAVSLATAATLEDPDGPLLTAALADLGIEATEVPWDDPTAEWAAFDATIIRSTWDYPSAHEEFCAWARSVPNLHNPAEVVVWNADKRYLDDLVRLGVPVIPTTYAASGVEARLPPGDVVVKPVVAGGSRGAARFAAAEDAAARAHVDTIAALGLVAMVQPHVASVDDHGEVDVVVIDGEVSHAVRKRAPIGLAATDGPSGPVGVDAVTPDAAELAVVRAALDAVPCAAPLCYARVDLVATADGPVVIELELIEPFLFLTEADGAAERVARAIARRATRSPG